MQHPAWPQESPGLDFRKDWKGSTNLPEPQADHGVLGMGDSNLMGSGTWGKSKLEADWSPSGEDGCACLSLKAPQNREARKRGERGGMGKKKGGKKREDQRGEKDRKNPTHILEEI